MLVAGCGSVSADGASDGGGAGGDDLWAGRTFLSTAVTVDGEPRPLVRGSQLSLTFSGERGMSLRAGCNTMFAAFDITDGRLTLTEPLGGTEMACEDPLMAQDEWIADFVASGLGYELAGGTLTLTGADTTIELVDEAVAVPDAALTGTEWVLEGIVSGSDETGAVASVPAGVRSTLRFEDDKVLAELGCNGGGGEVTVGNSTFIVREFAQTLMACGGAKDEVERTVAGVLGSDTEIGYAVDGETLTLRSGATGLIYSAA
jgi:heat shock protein HslJ